MGVRTMENKNIRKSVRKDEQAVSPVIGVILMVAITVILAAVIGAFVFGMGPTEAAATINFQASASDTAGTIDVVVMGGDNVTFSTLSITPAGTGVPTYTTAGSSFTIGSCTQGEDTTVIIADAKTNTVIFQTDVYVP